MRFIITGLFFIFNALLVQNESESLYQKLNTKINEPNLQYGNIQPKPKQCNIIRS
jgi:hypothetical protein